MSELVPYLVIMLLCVVGYLRERAQEKRASETFAQLSATIVAQSEHIIRLARREVGLAETPAEKRRPVEPLPDAVQALCNGWPQKHQRLSAERDARQLYARLGSWDLVLEYLQPKEVE